MKKIAKCFLITTITLFSFTTSTLANDVYVPFDQQDYKHKQKGEKVEFDDLNLKEALLEYYKFHIDKSYTGKELTVGMMEQFTSLSLPWANIFSLKGLDYAVNLKTLNLSNNFIEDLSPLEKLTRLEDLNLTNNKSIGCYWD